MRRIFWLAMGVTIGVLVYRKINEAAAAMKPEAIAQRTGRGAVDLADQAKSFFGDVRTAMREREDELRAGVGLDTDPPAPQS